MKTPEQLKGAIRNLAKNKGIHAQEVLQIFMFERIMERLSASSYKADFAGIERINSSAGFMEKVPGTKLICKRDYIF